MDLIEDPEALNVINSYPASIRQKVLSVRKLIIDAAKETEVINKLEETLKWGEPSYLTKQGSTVRVGWKESIPNQYGIYFHCQTKLVDTFKELYGDTFNYEGNRAILFSKTDKIPVNKLKHCVSLSLIYHKVKHLPLLGA